MVMTMTLANSIIENLCCLDLSARGAVNADGTVSPTDLDTAQNYARRKLIELCEEFEDYTGEEWQIEVEK